MRYVVLHHTSWNESHFDLLLETAADAPLASYRVSEWPPKPGTQVSINAPHRRLYLDYDGPVSGNRGVVTRVETGVYERIRETDTPHDVLLSSGIRLTLPPA